jgi:hypothetical protein
MEHIMHTSPRMVAAPTCKPWLQASRELETDQYPKPLHTSHGRDTKIHTVSNCESQGMTSHVGIVLLAGLGGLQIGLNTVNNFLSLCDKIGAKGHPLAWFKPVQRCTTSAAVESFERGHLETFLITIVARELSQWQALVPTVLIVHHTCTEHIF